MESMLADMRSKEMNDFVMKSFGTNLYENDESTLPETEEELALHMQMTYKQGVEVAEENPDDSIDAIEIFFCDGCKTDQCINCGSYGISDHQCARCSLNHCLSCRGDHTDECTRNHSRSVHESVHDDAEPAISVHESVHVSVHGSMHGSVHAISTLSVLEPMPPDITSQVQSMPAASGEALVDMLDVWLNESLEQGLDDEDLVPVTGQHSQPVPETTQGSLTAQQEKRIEEHKDEALRRRSSKFSAGKVGLTSQQQKKDCRQEGGSRAKTEQKTICG
jgi:hypothetical protein